jgi:signal transduction histidine kinase
MQCCSWRAARFLYPESEESLSQPNASFDLEAALITGRLRRLRVIIPIAAALVLSGLLLQGPVAYRLIGPALFGFQLITNICYLLALGVAWRDTGVRRVERATTLTVAGGLMFNVALSVTGPAHGTLVYGAPLMGMLAIGGVVLSPHRRAWLWGAAAGGLHVAMMIAKGLIDPTILDTGLGQHVGESFFVGMIILLSTWFSTRLIQDLNLALDETERARQRQAELNLEVDAARAQAQEASQAKTLFLAGMSHELRTPLNAIIGYVELVQEEMADEDSGAPATVADLEHVSDAAHHLLGLINNVLDMSKIEAGKMELLWEDVALGALLERVRSTGAPLASKRSNALVIEDETNGASWRSDKMKLQQSLLNLISNAAKFTETLLLDVEDTGVGIAPDKLERLFEAFEQADGARTSSQYGGTGLGLMLTRSFCDLLGGDIRVASTPGQGTSFSISLPRAVEAS